MGFLTFYTPCENKKRAILPVVAIPATKTPGGTVQFNTFVTACFTAEFGNGGFEAAFLIFETPFLTFETPSLQSETPPPFSEVLK